MLKLGISEGEALRKSNRSFYKSSEFGV